MFIECKGLFQKLLSPIKIWADAKSKKVEEHNAQLETIKRKVLMTVDEKI